MRAVAEAEAALLAMLGHMLPAGQTLRPSITMATRNELLREARELLPPEEWESYLCCADRLARLTGYDGLFPP